MKNTLKKVYNFIPLKKQIFSAIKIFYKPNESVFKHLHFKGIFTVPVDKSKSFKLRHYGFQVENEIFWNGLTGGWEKESLKLWIKICEEAETIFDIGANTGVYSLIAKTVNPKATVYAFEPVERVFTKLQDNIKLNNFNILPIDKAVSNFDGTAIIFDTNAEHTYSVTVNQNCNSPEINVFQTEITAVTLNTFIKEYKIKKIDLIKIDVETHEPEVLEGFSEYLTQFSPTILIEILNSNVAERVNNILKELNYTFFYVDEETGVHQVESIINNNYYNYLVCTVERAKRIGLIK